MMSQNVLCESCSRKSEKQADRKSARGPAAGILGLFCSAICLFGIPLLALLAPAALHAAGHGWIMVILSILSFALIGTALVQGVRRHRERGPAILAVLALGVAFSELAHVVPHLEMAASVLLMAAWFWDHLILKRLPNR
jgi:hypothetical protein